MARLLQDPPDAQAEWSADVVAARFLPKKSAGDEPKVEAELADLRTLLDLQTRNVIAATAAEMTATGEKSEVAARAFEKEEIESVVALAVCEL